MEGRVCPKLRLFTRWRSGIAMFATTAAGVLLVVDLVSASDQWLEYPACKSAENTIRAVKGTQIFVSQVPTELIAAADRAGRQDIGNHGATEGTVYAAKKLAFLEGGQERTIYALSISVLSMSFGEMAGGGIGTSLYSLNAPAAEEGEVYGELLASDQSSPLLLNEKTEFVVGRPLQGETPVAGPASVYALAKPNGKGDALLLKKTAHGLYEPQCRLQSLKIAWLDEPSPQFRRTVALKTEDLLSEPLRFSADGSRLAAKEGSRMVIFDATTGGPILRLESAETVEFSRDGLRLVTTSNDETARLWNARTGEPIATLSGHKSPVLSASFSPDGSRIVTASYDKTARLWDARIGEPIATLSGHKSAVLSATFSPDGSRILTASEDKTARLWDAHSGKPGTVLRGHQATIESAFFLPGAVRVLTISNDGTARIWDVKTGKQQVSLPTARSLGADSTPLSADGRRVVLPSYDGAVVWDGTTGQPIRELSTGGSVDRVNVSADGNAILVDVGGGRGTSLWNGDGKLLARSLCPSRGIVTRLAPNGTTVAKLGCDEGLWVARDWPSDFP